MRNTEVNTGHIRPVAPAMQFEGNGFQGHSMTTDVVVQLLKHFH